MSTSTTTLTGTPTGTPTGEGRPRHLLTVLHAAELTGPPLFALRLLRWLREQRPDWTLSTLFLDAGGPLEEPFAQIGPTVVRGAVAERSSGHSGRRALLDTSLRRQLRALGTLDAVHVHCVGSMRVVPALPRSPILCHIHEMSVGQDLHLGTAARRHLSDAARYVAVSAAARDAAVNGLGLEPAAIEQIWGFVDASVFDTRPNRSALGVAEDDLVVIGSGVRNWRKAPELFIRVATRAVRRHPDIPWRFIWIGGDDAGRCQDLAERAGLAGVVEFRAHTAEPLALIGAADIFALSAREDAFPLVCVEAAALGRPLVSFDSGGTSELIAAAGCGVVVDFPDVDEMADQLADLAQNPLRRVRLGDAGAAFAAENLSIDQAGPRLLSEIELTMASPSPANLGHPLVAAALRRTRAMTRRPR